MLIFHGREYPIQIVLGMDGCLLIPVSDVLRFYTFDHAVQLKCQTNLVAPLHVGVVRLVRAKEPPDRRQLSTRPGGIHRDGHGIGAPTSAARMASAPAKSPVLKRTWNWRKCIISVRKGYSRIMFESTIATDGGGPSQQE